MYGEVEGHTFKSLTFSLQDVETAPYSSGYEIEIDPDAVDANGVHYYELDGERMSHPIAQGHFALNMLSNYELTGEQRFLELALANADNLVQTYSEGEGAIWLSYPFDFPLHGDPDNTIHTPWHSAMAQGVLLSLTVKLAVETGDDTWATAADEVFESFLEVRVEDDLPLEEPWSVFVTDDGWLWLEEYAGDVEPMRVLNGHIFAMYGLYFYYQLTRDERAFDLFEGAASTVLGFVPKLRNPGDVSWYGMRVQDNPVAQNEGYHRIHVRQLAMLADMTGDERFDVLSEELRSDFY